MSLKKARKEAAKNIPHQKRKILTAGICLRERKFNRDKENLKKKRRKNDPGRRESETKRPKKGFTSSSRLFNSSRKGRVPGGEKHGRALKEKKARLLFSK